MERREGGREIDVALAKGSPLSTSSTTSSHLAVIGVSANILILPHPQLVVGPHPARLGLVAPGQQQEHDDEAEGDQPSQEERRHGQIHGAKGE